MQKESDHTKDTAKTIGANLILQVVTLLLSFVSRSAFIYELGNAYLGINGLFTNVLSLLSLAEFGVGTAITYSLYAPAKNSDYERLKSLMAFYKKCYQLIGFIIAGIGLIIMPLIPYMVNFETELDINLYLVYVLFLANSIISYWLMGYRQAVFIAMQTVYKMASLQTIIKFIATIINIAVLCIFKNYYVYLVALITITGLSNLVIGLFAGKEYPFLRSKQIVNLGSQEKKRIFKNVYAICVWKVGNTFVTSTDNILISIICGTVIVGYYSNYSLIYSSIITFYCVILNSLIPALGNINANNDPMYQQHTLQNLHFLNYWLLTFCSVCLMVLLGPFIEVWVGGIDANFVLDEKIPVIIGLNLWLTFIMSVVNQFKETLGLFDYGKYSQLLMGICNLILSVILGKKMGLAGILIATGISQFLFGFVLQPYYVFRYGFSKTAIPFLKETLRKFLFFIVIYGVIAFICSFITSGGLVSLVYRLCICIIVCNMLFFIRYRKSTEMQFGMMIVKKLINRKG